MIDIISIAVIILLTFTSTSLLPGLLATSTVPFLTLFFVVGLAYFQRGFGPMLIAALSGVLLDFISASTFGLHLGLFLFAVVVIRLLFQEGMKEMVFGHYIAVVLSAITLYFVTESLILYFGGVAIDLLYLLKSFAVFIGINFVFAILMYFFNNKYFDYVQKFSHYRKQG
jgi:cell shape-determining protein MreD